MHSSGSETTTFNFTDFKSYLTQITDYTITQNLSNSMFTCLWLPALTPLLTRINVLPPLS